VAAPEVPVAATPPPGPGTSAGKTRPALPRVRGGEAVVHALRRLISFYSNRLRKLESSNLQVDEETIHETRVATRRLRAGLRIAQPFFRRKLLRPIQAQLRETAQALGAVRDIDVIAAHVRSYASRDPGAPGRLASWTAELQERRARAHQALVDHLATKRSRRLRRDFQAFLTATAPGRTPRRDPAPGAPSGLPPPRVCDVIPATIWTQYGRVRAYTAIDELSIEALHALRIEIKRLRYLLEFFQSCLGAGAQPAIELAVRAQDHLGQLHDAHVAAGFVRSHIAVATTREPGPDIASMAIYLTAAEAEVAELRAAFPPIWRQLRGVRFRRDLAALLGRL